MSECLDSWWTDPISSWCHNALVSLSSSILISSMWATGKQWPVTSTQLSKRDPIRGTPSREGSTFRSSLRGRDGDGLCLCALLLSLYLIWFILLMWFAVAKPGSWILRNERSLICFLGCWCWGSKVTGFRVAFLYNLCATNAFTL